MLNSTNYLSLFELKHSLSRDQATLGACVRFLVCILFALLEATYGHLYPALFNNWTYLNQKYYFSSLQSDLVRVRKCETVAPRLIAPVLGGHQSCGSTEFHLVQLLSFLTAIPRLYIFWEINTCCFLASSYWHWHWLTLRQFRIWAAAISCD